MDWDMRHPPNTEVNDVRRQRGRKVLVSAENAGHGLLERSCPTDGSEYYSYGTGNQEKDVAIFEAPSEYRDLTTRLHNSFDNRKTKLSGLKK
jgi:hypothetical protein